MCLVFYFTKSLPRLTLGNRLPGLGEMLIPGSIFRGTYITWICLDIGYAGMKMDQVTAAGPDNYF